MALLKNVFWKYKDLLKEKYQFENEEKMLDCYV